MGEGFVIYGFQIGDGTTMGYEATEEDAYQAAKKYRKEMASDVHFTLPARTSVHRVVLRPVTKEILVAMLKNADYDITTLVQLTVALGYVD